MPNPTSRLEPVWNALVAPLVEKDWSVHSRSGVTAPGRSPSRRWHFFVAAGFALVLAPLAAKLGGVSPVARAADWPEWRRDAARSGASDEELPEELRLAWVRELARPRPAWPGTQEKIQFDRLYEPILAEKRLFLPSMVDDRLLALESDTGREIWSFFTEGPVRFAAVAWRDRVFFVSDDGCLYSVRAATGELVWKFRGGPSDRKLIGNERLISMWPARGAPVIYDDTIYFGAGVWPFMGIFLYALDCETGSIVWTNSGSGSDYIVQQHGSPAFAGVAPQGYIAATADHLVVSGGRTVPAVYDRHTGRFLQYNVQSRDMGSKGGGGYEVVAGKDFYVNRGALYRMEDGKFIDHLESPVLTRNIMIGVAEDELRGYLLGYSEVKEKDRKGEETTKLVVRRAWTAALDLKLEQLFLKSGSRVYGRAANREIVAVDLPTFDAPARLSWRRRLPDTALNMIAADQKLIVTTDEGRIYCFSDPPVEADMPSSRSEVLVPTGAVWRYLDDGSEPGPGWVEPNFDDSSWKSGAARLGYGGDGETTKVEFGDDAKKKHISTRFRHRFSVPRDRDYSKSSVEVLVDDGAAVWLDGVEVGRLFLPKGELKSDTVAEGGTDEKTYYPLELDPALLTPGPHVLSVDVRQRSGDSSDLALDLRVIGSVRRSGPGLEAHDDDWGHRARDLLALTGAEKGWCVALGLGSERLAEEIASRSDLRVVLIDADAAGIDALRKRLSHQGVYGSRIAVVAADPDGIELPPYFAELVVAVDAESSIDYSSPASAARLYSWLRPTSGVAVLPLDVPAEAALASALTKAAVDRPRFERREASPDWVILSRPYLPAGSGSFSHQYGDAANTVASDDTIVRAPLGLLWFGGPSNEGVLPRHGHGPTPHVAGGRITIEGRDMLRSLDLYTGRLLWEVELPGVGEHYDYTSHEPGANEIGSNYVSLDDVIYIVHEGRCLELDAATGKTLRTFELPGADEAGKPPRWGYVAVAGDVLLGGARFEGSLVPVFTDREVERLKGEALVEAADRVGDWLGFIPRRRDESAQKETDEKKKEEAEVAANRLFVLDNLNKLLTEPGFLDRIPERVRNRVKDRDKLADLERKLVAYYAEVPGRQPDDFDAVALKRHLLSLYYGLPDFDPQPAGKFGSFERTGSRKLAAFDRKSGTVLWERSAHFEFRPNAVAAGGGIVFCLDRMPEREAALRRRRGEEAASGERLLAFDLQSGDELWATREDVFGTWLGYSAEHDVLLEAGSRSRDRAVDEVGKGMIAYRGKTGEVIWSNDLEYEGPCIILGEKLITQGHGAPGFALDLRTGEKILVPHPVTGVPVAWQYTRNYGCNTAIACPQLLTFRSAAAGYYDLQTMGGTGNLGGFRSGCTTNLIPGGGVLAAPDYTRTCTCSYQNQASLALVPMPEVEMWTFTSFDADRGPVDRVGLNFGAPGDRRAPNGTLWLDWPSRGGKSPDLRVYASKALEDAPVRFHPSRIAAGAVPSWIGSSALVGEGELRVEVLHTEDIRIPNEIAGGTPIVTRRGRLSVARPVATLASGRRNAHSLAPSDPKEFSATIASDATLAPPSITVELWLRTDADLPAWIDARGENEGSEDEKEGERGFVLRERDLELVYWVIAPSGEKKSIELEAAESIEKERWHHVAWTYDAATGRGRLFLDGELIDDDDGEDGASLYWGETPPGWKIIPGATARTAIDELRVARAALSPDAFLLASASSTAPDSIAGDWRMDAGAPENGPGVLPYTVRLIFAELEGRDPGERVFDVTVDDLHRIESIDPARDAGGSFRTTVEEIRHLPVSGWLRIELAARTEAPPILCGLEIVRERD